MIILFFCATVIVAIIARVCCTQTDWCGGGSDGGPDGGLDSGEDAAEDAGEDAGDDPLSGTERNPHCANCIIDCVTKKLTFAPGAFDPYQPTEESALWQPPQQWTLKYVQIMTQDQYGNSIPLQWEPATTPTVMIPGSTYNQIQLEGSGSCNLYNVQWIKVHLRSDKDGGSATYWSRKCARIHHTNGQNVLPAGSPGFCTDGGTQ